MSLAKLNALRAENNMKPLKAWKESKAKLEAAIMKLTPVTKAPAKVAEGAYPSETRAKEMTGHTTKGKKITPAPKIRAPKADKPASQPRDNALAEAIAAAGLTAKKARAKFRKAGLSGPYSLTPEIKKLLTK